MHEPPHVSEFEQGKTASAAATTNAGSSCVPILVTCILLSCTFNFLANNEFLHVQHERETVNNELKDVQITWREWERYGTN